MRVTAETKELTRERILEAAAALFAEQGFDATTTRELATRSGIATGTLFNYFPTKEDLGMALVADALAAGAGDYAARRRGDESLEEDLFALVAAHLRHLDPVRSFLGEVIDAALSPFQGGSRCAAADDVRTTHLEQVGAILAAHGARGDETEFPAVLMHLYWTLYLGVLAHLASDDSPGHEQTLALLDETTRMFARAARERSRESESMKETP